MPLDPQLQILLASLAQRPAPDLAALPPLEAAAAMRAGSMRSVQPVDHPARHVEERKIAGPHGPLRLRIYHPAEQRRPPGIVIKLHGGGWALGSIDADDAHNHALCRASGCIVVAVGYRLAPEYPFPVALEESAAALDWVADQARGLGGDAARIGLFGVSAGGNLAAATCLTVRDRGGPPIACQVLLYPVCDADFSRPSYDLREGDAVLSRAKMIWFWDQYVPDPAARLSPLASPLRAPTLCGLPPALVITGEYDILRDEGEAFASRLDAAGVPVQAVRVPGIIHGTLSVAPDLPRMREVDRMIAAFLAQRLG